MGLTGSTIPSSLRECPPTRRELALDVFPSSLIEERQFAVQANLQYLFLNSTGAAMVCITVLNLRRKVGKSRPLGTVS